ncbi:hypothetical protein GCM10010464_54110 [Pseudonocardia yunnanensis]
MGLARCPFPPAPFMVSDGRRAELTNSAFGAAYGVLDGTEYSVCDTPGYARFGFGYRCRAGEQLTTEFVKEFLRTVWLRRIEFVRLDLENSEQEEVHDGVRLAVAAALAVRQGPPLEQRPVQNARTRHTGSLSSPGDSRTTSSPARGGSGGSDGSGAGTRICLHRRDRPLRRTTARLAAHPHRRQHRVSALAVRPAHKDTEYAVDHPNARAADPAWSGSKTGWRLSVADSGCRESPACWSTR